MGRSQESYNKKEVRSKKDKKRKEKEQKRQAKRGSDKSNSLDDMIAYVDENGNITSTPPDPTKKTEIKVEDIEINVPRKEDVPFDPIRKGNVTFYNESKGFGFIRDSETSESVFFHINNAYDDIKENNMVSFEVEPGPKGPVAVNITPIK